MITVTLIIAMVKVKSNENEIMKLMHFYITQMQRAGDASNINNHTNYAPDNTLCTQTRRLMDDLEKFILVPGKR